jgi:glycosyltransferase involved in cell wall biosynthesis
MLGAKVILDVHDLMPELYMSKFRMDDTKRLIRFITWIEKRSIDFAHKAIAVHKPQLDILLKHGNSEEKFIILLNVPDPKIFVSHNNVEPVFNKKFRLIYHGTIAMRHGIDVALHAIAQALKEIPHLEFQIVGEGDDLERVVAMANGLKLSNCVQFSDKAIPLDLIPSMIDQADVGIVPMLNDQFTRHTLPVKLLEYVLMGKPVIASRIEGLEAYFDDTMISYFKPGDTVDLADRIVDLYRHPEKARQFVSNSNRFNEEFNWQSQKKLYYNLIDSLLQA